MSEYYASSRTAATAATADNAGAALWNPSSTVAIRVFEFGWEKTVATADFLAIKRITARGTATSTVTVAASNDTENSRTPTSGALLDVTYSAQPTVTGNYLYRWGFPAALACGIIWTFPNGLLIPPGAGIALVTPVATILQPADVTVRFTDPA